MRADVLVAGGGCVGVLAAGLCAQAGWRVVLATPQAPLRPLNPDAPPNPRVIALAPLVEQALQAAGVPPSPWRERACPVHSMDVSVPGQGGLCFQAREAGLPELAHIVEVPALQQALESWAQSLGVRRIDESVLHHQEGVAELDSGARIEAQLLLACDGADSGLRQAAGIDTRQRDYRQQAIVARLRFAQPHHSQARQTMGGEGVLGVLPLVDGSVSVVWSLPEAQAAYWLAAPAAEFAEGLSLALAAPWGEARLLGPRQSFPLRAIRAEQLHAPGLALLGDAAHTVHPLAGLGLNLGLADALSLVEVLRRARQQGRALDDPASLAAWSRSRRAAVLPYTAFIDALAGLETEHVFAWRGVASGFNSVQRWQAVKSFFIHQASKGSLAGSAGTA